MVIIGSKVKEDLFGFSDALGKKIKVKNKTFRVIGILPKKGQVMIFNLDDLAIVPYLTAQKYLTGNDHYNSILV
ncbi:ABC transporter permease [Candidatus Peregrinibacteria bacterium]|nr:ABC transporter permease [Candidatus Peregrinibacteria bacterium]